MNPITIPKKIKEEEIYQLKLKAAIFDELIEVLEDKYLGHFMSVVENERNIPLSKSKKMMSI